MCVYGLQRAQVSMKGLFTHNTNLFALERVLRVSVERRGSLFALCTLYIQGGTADAPMFQKAITLQRIRILR